ncbi:SMC domain protein [Nitrosotalea sinensis]|uniref:SMC domain protein n=1 Tax=Nitrosotalea sinensis TaxID=1499975 RepID=A0A2H1EH75_9ARCH|nr:AAA family ATPase [Candidatus Nitrosotalea sinensis]SHO46236.1 SMC domain protein [Candidatus Nitrosotalea sinensis]
MLQSVELENFLSHKNTKLTFEKGVTVFVGPNGAGKSSIIDAITFALFGEHLRKSTKGLLRRGDNQSYAKVEFSIGDRQFEAIRKIDSKGTVGAVLNEKKDGQIISLAAGERKQFGESMTKTIESLVGLDFEKLKVASIVQQGELQTIIEADPKKFKELVNAIIGIDKLDIAYESMRKTIDNFRLTVKTKIGHDDTDILTLQNRIEHIQKEITMLEPQKKKLEDDRIIQEQKFLLLQQEIEIETPKELKIKEIVNKKDDLVKYLKNFITTKKREVDEKKRRLAECTNSLSITSVKPHIEQEMKNIQADIDRIRGQTKEAGEKIAMIRGQQEIANRLHLIDGKCPVCDSKVDKLNPLFEEGHLKSELTVLKNKTDMLTKEENLLQSKKRELDQKWIQITKAEGILALHKIKDQDDLSILSKEIESIETSTKNIPLELNITNILQYAIDDYSSDLIKTISALIEETKGFDSDKFRELKLRLEQQRGSIGTIEREIGSVDAKLRLYKDETAQISNAIAELQDAKQYITTLETIRNQIYNRDGPVATSLRSWALGTISQKASEYLTTFNVKIQRISLEDKARDIVITCHSGNSELDLESLSGGEKVSIALALRLGMAHLMGSSNLNFIILDEPTTHLDQERRKSLVSVLSQAFESNIDAISQFIIITHDSEIFENSNIDTIYEFKSTPDGTLVTPL